MDFCNNKYYPIIMAIFSVSTQTGKGCDVKFKGVCGYPACLDDMFYGLFLLKGNLTSVTPCIHLMICCLSRSGISYSQISENALSKSDQRCALNPCYELYQGGYGACLKTSSSIGPFYAASRFCGPLNPR